MAGDKLVPKPQPVWDAALQKWREPTAADEHAGCRAQIKQLEASVQWQCDRYDQLHKTYLQLVDQWSAFQMQFRGSVTPRQANRAEAAGELSRLIANALLCVAYDKDGVDLLVQVMERLRALQAPAEGREVVTHRVETGLVKR